MTTDTPVSHRIEQGQAIVLFAFDVGYEIDLNRIQQMFATQPIKPLSGTKQTPSHLQYMHRPQIVPLEDKTLPSGLTGQVQATLYDFGAVSIEYTWPLGQDENPMTIEQLPAFSKALFESDLEADARRRVEALSQKIRPAVIRPLMSSLVEDYYIYVVRQLDASLSAQELLQQYQTPLAQALRFETGPLSMEQQKEALAKAISYYRTDLALVDWNAAIIFDPDYHDTVRVLELLNIELLEARYLDTELDKRINAYDDVVSKHPRYPIPLLSPYRNTIKELAELRIEAALLAERVDNALKLIGDLYLARIHVAATERFYIATWDASISRKLDIIDSLYQVLTDRISNTQTQTLELIIILLIMLEIFFK